MKTTRKTAAMGARWLVSVLLVAWAAAPAFADDPPMQDWTGGQTAPAPAPVVENQVPADFQTGVFDMGGNRLGANMEEVQAKEQAKVEAFQAAHPDPGNGSGFRDLHGNYLGANFREAAEAGLLPGVDPKVPYDVEGAKALAERHGAEKVYINPQTGDAFTYGTQDGRVVTKEEFFAEQERTIKKNNAVMRGVLGGADDPAVDAQTKNAISQTLAVIEKSEREQAEDLQRQREEAKRYVPAKTLRSFEANSSQEK